MLIYGEKTHTIYIRKNMRMYVYIYVCMYVWVYILENQEYHVNRKRYQDNICITKSYTLIQYNKNWYYYYGQTFIAIQKIKWSNIHSIPNHTSKRAQQS